jgi:hypothetical protein
VISATAAGSSARERWKLGWEMAERHALHTARHRAMQSGGRRRRISTITSSGSWVGVPMITVDEYIAMDW